jgi:low temperature requirement protein LtrA
MTRDSYTYRHVPMITGIILFAIGVKRTLLHVSLRLHTVIAVAVCGGGALYLVALSAFKRRNIGSFNRQRLVVAAVLCCLIPATTRIPALAALGMVTAAACGLIAFDFIPHSETRERIRHGSRRS